MARRWVKLLDAAGERMKSSAYELIATAFRFHNVVTRPMAKSPRTSNRPSPQH